MTERRKKKRREGKAVIVQEYDEGKPVHGAKLRLMTQTKRESGGERQHKVARATTRRSAYSCLI